MTAKRKIIFLNFEIQNFFKVYFLILWQNNRFNSNFSFNLNFALQYFKNFFFILEFAKQIVDYSKNFQKNGHTLTRIWLGPFPVISVFSPESVKVKKLLFNKLDFQ